MLRFALLGTVVLALGCQDTRTAALAPKSASRPTAIPRADPHTAYESVLLKGVPHVFQKPDFCGEAATASWLSALGSPVDQDQVFALSGMPPELGMGATTRELKVALERLGFDVGPVWNSVPAGDTSALDAIFAELHGDLTRHVPSIVCMHYDRSPQTTEHFRLVLGYDAAADEVIYHEPAEPDGAYRRMARHEFMQLWPLKYDPERWTVIRLPLAGGAPAVPPRPRGFVPADFAEHVRRIRRPRQGAFTIVVESPFVVLGDDSPEQVKGHASHVVRWAVDRLKRDFFAREPERILDVWLFKDSASYESNAVSLFGERPSTPYGYYSPEHGALVMNIATGGGTLVHEIVHPFMAANFPRCPAWFNEGLGSLFEQADEREGHIVGLPNWRLPGLKHAIRRGTVPSFREFTRTSTRAFYEEDPGTNYAQARYLLYYLQEQGLLVRYFHEFVAHAKEDATGYGTLVRVLGSPDMTAFQQRWANFVLGLRQS